MPSEAFIGRVGGLAVALGVGAAIASGWSNAPAWADDLPAAEKPTAAQDSGTEPAATALKTAADGPESGARPAAKPPHRSLFDAVRRAVGGTHSDPPSTARTTSQRRIVDRTDNVVIARVEALAADVRSTVKAVRRVDFPTPSSAVVTPTPRKPVDSPAVWALHAFARREFEPGARAPTAPPPPQTASRTTSETKVAEAAVEPEQRTLVLTAFPAEADAILARTTLDENPVVVVDGRHYYLGTLGGKKVIVAMTGIGMENATNTTETALTHFTPESGTTVKAVVFTGVAGGAGRTQIGDVAVPARWTADGETWHPVDADMLAAANTVAVDLQSTDTIADPSCRICGPLSRLRLVDLGREPQLHVGGDGSSDDNNNGAPFPAIPVGGAVFGPQPLGVPDFSPFFTGNFLRAIGPFLARGVLSNVTGFLTAGSPPVDAVDQETAAAQQVADAHGVPFLGIRGMSDGPGDPLNLPGYPFSFFVYKQIAADNAATVTEAFLQNWDDA